MRASCDILFSQIPPDSTPTSCAAVCAADTVVEINVPDRTHYVATGESTVRQVGSVADCATICRMHGDGCVGFVHDGTCALLFEKDGRSRERLTKKRNQKVYSIAKCL